MTRFAGVVLLVAVAAALAAGTQALGAKPLTVQSSGTISNIGPLRVKVGHLTCAIRGAKTGAMAARFVIGDPVRLMCRDGVLATIRYRPLAPIVESSSPSSPKRASPASSNLNRLDGVTGAISGLSTTTITFGNPITLGNLFSCAIGERSPDLSGYAVGDRVSATCTNGTLTSIKPPS